MTKTEAAALNLKHYLGVPCKRGHTPPRRLTATGDCTECKKGRIRTDRKTRPARWSGYSAKLHFHSRAEKRRLDRKTKPWHALVAAIRSKVKRVTGKPCELSYKWAAENYTGFCALSGLPFDHEYGRGYSTFTMSVDRINPKIGYTDYNCRFVLCGLNSLKSTGTDEDVVAICRAVVAKADGV